ncbi:hypothetical protein K440DRAFT_54515, partial [Wilcoxina mikolae CBS 423.85]
ITRIQIPTLEQAIKCYYSIPQHSPSSPIQAINPSAARSATKQSRVIYHAHSANTLSTARIKSLHFFPVSRSSENNPAPKLGKCTLNLPQIFAHPFPLLNLLHPQPPLETFSQILPIWSLKWPQCSVREPESQNMFLGSRSRKTHLRAISYDHGASRDHQRCGQLRNGDYLFTRSVEGGKNRRSDMRGCRGRGGCNKLHWRRRRGRQRRMMSWRRWWWWRRWRSNQLHGLLLLVAAVMTVTMLLAMVMMMVMAVFFVRDVDDVGEDLVDESILDGDDLSGCLRLSHRVDL